jgi:hypothetical protein
MGKFMQKHKHEKKCKQYKVIGTYEKYEKHENNECPMKFYSYPENFAYA